MPFTPMWPCTRSKIYIKTVFRNSAASLALYSSEKVQSGTNIEDAIQRLEGADDDGFGIPMPVTTGEPEPATELPGQDALEAGDAGEVPVGTPASETPPEPSDGTEVAPAE